MILIRFLLMITLFLNTTGVDAQSATLSPKTLFKSGTSGVACYRIPAIATAPNGDVIVAVDQRVPSCGDLKWNEDINIVLRKSSDNGVTWSPLKVVVDCPLGISASDPSMIVDREKGTIFLFFNYMDLKKAKDIYRLKYIKSTDNGTTWTTPIDITEQIVPPKNRKDFQFITSGQGVQTASGMLLHTLVNLQKGLFVFASDDHGEHWYALPQPLKKGDESKIIALPNGDWLINSRINGLQHRFVHVSKDQGKTWQSEPDISLIDPGCNAAILGYTTSKGGYRLLFSNLYHPKKRKHLTLRSSADFGKSWTKPKTVYKGASAYSDMTLLSNGAVGLIFEKDDYQEIAFVVLAKKWIEAE